MITKNKLKASVSIQKLQSLLMALTSIKNGTRKTSLRNLKGQKRASSILADDIEMRMVTANWLFAKCKEKPIRDKVVNALIEIQWRKTNKL
jgi:hypothetical protein